MDYPCLSNRLYFEKQQSYIDLKQMGIETFGNRKHSSWKSTNGKWIYQWQSMNIYVSYGVLVFSCIINQIFRIISSPESSGSHGELIKYPYSGVRCRRRCRSRCCRRRRQQCLNIFSSETALPIKAKSYVEPPWEGGTKVYINGPSHMTKMAAMSIYGKNL